MLEPHELFAWRLKQPGVARRRGSGRDLIVPALDHHDGGAQARFAAWVHERDQAMRGELERRGYTLEESTRAMGMALEDVRLPRPQLDLGPPAWFEYLRILGVPRGFLDHAHQAAFHILLARLDGENVATAMAYDFGGDCGIYDVGTLEHARRRGLGTALTAIQVHDALARGCRTASLQSTPMAEGVYAAVGFRDLGRILEYMPRTAPAGRPHGALDR